MKNVLNRLGWVCLCLMFFNNDLIGDCTLSATNLTGSSMDACTGIVTISGSMTINPSYTVPGAITRIIVTGTLTIANNRTLSLPATAVIIFNPGSTLATTGGCDGGNNIVIGSTSASCDGSGSGTDFSFAQVYTAGGMTSTGLPITLSTFQARSEEGGALITWKVSTEINNDKMLVERSKDGQRFREIGQVKGRGTSTIPFEYQYFDNNPGTGDTYYRLKQVDFNGSFEYSKVIALNTEGFIQLYIYPNPTRERIFVRSTEEVVLAGLHLFDGLGRKFLLQWSGGNGLYEAVLPQGLPTGLYILSDVTGAHQGKISVQQ
jgi:hypothetical protein